MSKPAVVIEGLPELLKTIERLRVPPEDVEPILFAGAKDLQARIKAQVYVDVKRQTGQLEKSIVAKRRGGGNYFRSVFTAADLKKARHSRLVEHGHRIVTRSGIDTGKRAKAFPYFWPTVERELPSVGERIIGDLQKLIESKIR